MAAARHYVTVFIVSMATMNSTLNASTITSASNCTHNTTMIEVTCQSELVTLNNSDYEFLGNGTILYYNETLQVACYDDQGRPIVCLDNSPDYSDVQLFTILVRVSCSVSIVGNMVVLVSYCVFKVTHTLLFATLANLCTANMAFDIIVVVGGSIGEVVNVNTDSYCLGTAITLHYFLLCQFALMPCVMVETVRSFHKASQLKTDSKQYMVVLLAGYMTFGWGVPLLIVLLAITLNFTTLNLVRYGFDGYECWISHRDSEIALLDTPVYISIIFNLIVFLTLVVLIVQAYRLHRKCGNKQKRPPYLRFAIAMFCSSGIFWILTTLKFAIPNVWFERSMIIINCGQGLAICVAFFCTKKVLRLYWNMVRHCKLTEQHSSAVRPPPIVNCSDVKLSETYTKTH